MKEKLSIVKIGGNIIEDEVSLMAFLKLFSNFEAIFVARFPPPCTKIFFPSKLENNFRK